MRPLVRPAALLSLTAALALAGCGGSSYPSSADSICKQYNKKINAVPRPTSTAGLSGYIVQVTPLFHQAIAKLKAVKPPSDKKAAYDRYVTALNREATTLDQAGGIAKTNTRQAIGLLLTAQQQLSSEEKSQAKAAGLKTCAASG